jgi:DNA repair exonuclease SbcCD ATPase subunit
MGDIETIKLRGITCAVVECGECGIPYTVPLTVYETHKREGGFHYCPNNHGWGWEKSASTLARERERQEAIRRERDRAIQENARLEESVKAWMEQATMDAEARRTAERQAAAAKGQATKLRKRASAGTCPCCNRTFKQLAAHMASKHPTFLAEEVSGDGVAKH